MSDSEDLAAYSRLYPGIGSRPRQILSHRPLRPTGDVALSNPSRTLGGRPASASLPPVSVDDVLDRVNEAMRPYEAEKSLVMTQHTYNALMRDLLALPADVTRQDYMADLSMIYNFPRTLVKDKIARCMDPNKQTNREGFLGYLQWAADNRILPGGTSVESVMRRFDARDQAVSGRHRKEGGRREARSSKDPDEQSTKARAPKKRKPKSKSSRAKG